MQSFETVTPAATPPVSTATLKAHLRLNDSTEDTLLAEWVLAASDLFTRATGYVLISTGFRLNLDAFPSTGTIFIPRRPVSAVASVEYLDNNASWQTLAGTTTDLSSTPARVILPSSLPAVHTTRVPTVRVNFTAGHANAAACPPLALVAVKLLASHWYAHREAFGEAALSDIPQGWRDLCNRFDLGIRGTWNE